MLTTTLSSFWLRTAIHTGSNSRALAPDLFRGMGAKRVVLFSDRGLEKAGIVEKVAEIFKLTPHGTGPELAGIFLDITQDAESKCVNAAARYAREVGADALLAVGGGSVLDTVKGVKYSLFKGLTDISEAIPGGFVSESFPQAQHIPIPHIAIPTTAGTGSEVSPIAVIYNEEIKLKTNIINPFLSADMAILDPDLTTGLPPLITAFTGMDALTHAIEALASPNATSLTDSYALHTIRLIEKNLPIAVSDGSNLEARMEMLQASLMGITAFSFALNAIPVHNLAHAYGAIFRIPHGLANAVFLPIVMEYIPDLYLPKVKELAQALGIKADHEDPAALLEKAIEKIRLLQVKTGLPADFSQYNISAENLQKAISAVASDPAAVNFPLPKELIEAIGQRVVPLPVQ
ncbi:iron-containing alcohol dehydrogenase [Peribacillus cavernae]|uniref:Iron-containing alcohol dehydrogenase n=1 Tax=Peribacillus cavernae TaxID=1674310 RepID=A0A3S1B989_9BACI|nr:iron-containing alcohol dehydrogenase [Peribacillus cavernae]MDQ0218834.1 alcohol dehydrogenase class IV [Peribacillus cavernae]RUQ31039.1 iron-containing alcohol dehydrogenase [Peribacillus cavernae]